ncbi:hypothetical protein WI641_23145, partial [Salmonella enterica subsp. enterica serovar Corvallis]
VRQQQDEPGRFSICSRQAAVVLSRCAAWEGAECLTESSCSGGERPDKREKHPFIPNPTSAFNYASTFPKHAKSVSYTPGWAR